jgi:hypothetical protein
VGESCCRGEEEVGPVEVNYRAERLWWGANGDVGCVDEEVLSLVMSDNVMCQRGQTKTGEPHDWGFYCDGRMEGRLGINV